MITKRVTYPYDVVYTENLCAYMYMFTINVLLFCYRVQTCKKPCASDCVVSKWSGWSTCSKTCGKRGGLEFRKRQILGISCLSSTVLSGSIFNLTFGALSRKVNMSNLTVFDSATESKSKLPVGCLLFDIL